ncbi:MAG: hypothetical protein OHK93_005406 [Ramalina farinacea]|uniref:Reverse transcriptase n=1 Tax=Ramalina farinacea TaxID=258253 RepID=A0AA43TTG4_9LECA|nr:hypothetical protein [Ramalina farinacea]
MDASNATAKSMRDITTTKLAALSARRQTFEAERKRIQAAVAVTEDVQKRVQVLLTAFDHLEIEKPQDLSTANLHRFLHQSRHDPSLSASMLLGWQAKLESALDVRARRDEHALLFGRIVMEWLENSENNLNAVPGDALDTGESFEQIGSQAMHDQRKEWESIVFAQHTAAEPQRITTYLEQLFGSTEQSGKLALSPLENLRKSMASFELGHLTQASLSTCIEGLLLTELLSEQKKKALADFSNNSLILGEMMDVLNMQIDALESWTWGSEAIPVVVRRALNGKYRVYMEEEIIQALLLYHIGMKWALQLKVAFTAFFHSGAWLQSSRKPMSASARRHRQDHGLSTSQSSTVRNERRDQFIDQYFMAQLPNSDDTTVDEYDDEDDDQQTNRKSAIALNQSLLHLISTEALTQTHLYGNFTILQSDFRWFGPSLPHPTILTVLRFFGMKPFWLDFLEKFMKAPMKFTQDGPDTSTHVRQCGVPIQHRLSAALGEAVLFCLDFAVSKSTETNLYRVHDDLWFWGSKPAAVTAWQTMQEFADVMGLSLNPSKTGALEVRKAGTVEDQPSDLAGLPTGDTQSGFLKMDPRGRWVLDYSQVEKHIKQVQKELSASPSVFAWVQAWNAYVARFFSRSFGEPARCLGQPHMDMAIEAHEKIEKAIFGPDGLSGGNVLEHLRHMLSERFGVADIPDGFFYFPVELGGLGLRNPVIPLLLRYKNNEKNPRDLIERAFEHEEERYNRDGKSFEEGNTFNVSKHVESFMTFDEYVAFAEETSSHLQRAYTELLDMPTEEPVDRETTNYLDSTDLYETWMLELYGGEIKQKYGGLAMGESRLLPIGLVKMLQKERVRWQN